MVSESQKKATLKYKKKMVVNKTVAFYKKGDADLIEYIEKLSENGIGFSSYIKWLLREDLKKNHENKKLD